MCSFVVQPADRVKDATESIWVQLAGLAAEHGAVNLGQGFPDYGPEDHVVKSLVAAASDVNRRHLYQYTRGYGHPFLVHQLAKMYTELLNVNIDPMNNILITVGAYLALFHSFCAYLGQGDEERKETARLQVILIEPFFDCYEPQVKFCGAQPVFVPLRQNSENMSDADVTTADFCLDFDEMEQKITNKTKMIVVNNPNNPLGKLYTREELLKIAQIALKHNLLVVSDEVYEWLIYPPGKMIRMAALPGMWERTITIGSAGKTFSTTGLKTGWAIAPQNLLAPLKLVHQNCVYTCPTVVQEAIGRSLEYELSLGLNSAECYFNRMPVELVPKRDRMVSLMKKASLRPIIPESGYFMLANYSNMDWPVDTYGDQSEAKDFRFVRWLCEHKV